MPGITTEFLFSIALEVPVLALGDTPYGGRRIARFGGGSFEGPKLRGVVLPGGGGWMILRHDGVLDIEVRVVLKTDDKQMIYIIGEGSGTDQKMSSTASIAAPIGAEPWPALTQKERLRGPPAPSAGCRAPRRRSPTGSRPVILDCILLALV
jgi:hypothetical protein